MLLKELFETIPDHMGLDLVKDVSINPTEILAQYNSVDGDIEQTLAKLQQFNPSWRMIVQKYGRDYAKKLVFQTVKS